MEPILDIPSGWLPLRRGQHHVEVDDYRLLMSSFPTGVAIVTSIGWDMLPRGATCSSLSSVTLAPPTLLVCLKTGSSTLDAIRTRNCFAVNLLHARARRTAEIFSYPVDDRFAHVRWRPTGTEGLPWLVTDALAVAECSVAGLFVVGDHTVVLGEVTGVEILSGVPLLYGMRQFSAWTIDTSGPPRSGGGGDLCALGTQGHPTARAAAPHPRGTAAQPTADHHD